MNGANKRTMLDEDNPKNNKKLKLSTENKMQFIDFENKENIKNPIINQFYTTRFDRIEATDLYTPDEIQFCAGWTELMKYTIIATQKSLKNYLTSVNLKDEINKQNQLGYSALLLAASYGLTSKCLL